MARRWPPKQTVSQFVPHHHQAINGAVAHHVTSALRRHALSLTQPPKFLSKPSKPFVIVYLNNGDTLQIHIVFLGTIDDLPLLTDKQGLADALVDPTKEDECAAFCEDTGCIQSKHGAVCCLLLC